MTRVSVITGSAAGIGAAFARRLARDGDVLVLLDLEESRIRALAAELKAAYGVQVHVLVEDLADPDTPKRVLQAIEALDLEVDMLVNNAGFITDCLIQDMPIEQMHECLQVMLRSCVDLAHGLLPGMRTRGHGRIINIASIYAFIPWLSWDGLYGPIKAFILQWSRKLNLDMAADGVHVTAICPGFTRTELWRERSKQPSVPKMLWLNPETVAEQALRAVDRGRPVCIPGFLNRCLCRFAPLLPARLLRRYWRAV